MKQDKMDYVTKGIVHQLKRSDDPLTTSDLANKIGTEVDTKQVNYRLGKLESHDYVEIDQVDLTEWDKGGLPPKTAELTPVGREWAKDVDTTGWDSPDTLSARVTALEEIVEEQQKLINQLTTATGINQDDQNLPDVMDMRVGYTAVNNICDKQLDTKINTHIGKLPMDEYRNIKKNVE